MSTPKHIVDFIEHVEDSFPAGSIYRGEPKIHDEVSSSLYRELDEDTRPYLESIVSAEEHFCRAHGRKNEIGKDNSTAGYPIGWMTPEVFLFNTLNPEPHGKRLLDTEGRIQHYDGKANIIDFTSSAKVALFFACRKFAREDGRIIILEPNTVGSDEVFIHECPAIRETQKSQLVTAKKGVIDDYKSVKIPSNYKIDIVMHLGQEGIHNVSLYNDFQGGIQLQPIRLATYKHILKGHKELTLGSYSKAIEQFEEVLNYDTINPTAYLGCGIARWMLDETEAAYNDFHSLMKIRSGTIRHKELYQWTTFLPTDEIEKIESLRKKTLELEVPATSHHWRQHWRKVPRATHPDWEGESQ